MTWKFWKDLKPPSISKHKLITCVNMGLYMSGLDEQLKWLVCVWGVTGVRHSLIPDFCKPYIPFSTNGVGIIKRTSVVYISSLVVWKPRINKYTDHFSQVYIKAAKMQIKLICKLEQTNTKTNRPNKQAIPDLDICKFLEYNSMYLWLFPMGIRKLNLCPLGTSQGNPSPTLVPWVH